MRTNENNSISYYEKYSFVKSGENVSVNENSKYGYPHPEGGFRMNGNEYGLSSTQSWTVLYSSSTALVIQYCSDMPGLDYEGVKVLSRNGVLAGNEPSMIYTLLLGLGYEVNDMCHLKPLETCSEHGVAIF